MEKGEPMEKSEAELRVERAEAELEAAKAALKEDRKIQDVVNKLEQAAREYVETVTKLIGESPDPVSVYNRANKKMAELADMENVLKDRYPKVYNDIVLFRSK